MGPDIGVRAPGIRRRPLYPGRTAAVALVAPHLGARGAAGDVSRKIFIEANIEICISHRSSAQL